MMFIISGYDVIEWIMERLKIEDGTEALHFASLLCQYGYFFPVTDTKNLTVKDDGTLYRFQVSTIHNPFHLQKKCMFSYNTTGCHQLAMKNVAEDGTS